MTLVASLAVLSACSSGGGGSPGPTPPPPPPNVPPVASAGPNQTVDAATVVTLNGSGSNDPDGSIASYAWTQTAGSAVTLSSGTVAQPTFTAPGVATATTLTFSLTVTDNRGATSPAATVSINVNPLPAGSLTGRITFVRIPFGAGTFAGLNYGSPQSQPARGITVRALPAGGGAAIGTAVTDANGDYAMTVTANASVTIEVAAEMVRSGALPNWNFTVRDLPASPTPIPTPLPAILAYTDGQTFNAGTGAHNVVIPSGFNASGAVIGTRASAPFAILDTLYQGVTLVRSAAPNTNFPELVVDWGPNNIPEDGTFFTASTVQHIVLTADVTADTDEFDQHVIAHEFGHYIEYNFSRADNIGGSHGVGDKLDPRVAFGEGFGYAFGAMVLNDPVTRDSYVDDTSPAGCSGIQCSSTFNVESNPPASGGTNGNFGCWCSESSVWSILWDIYDQVPDINDAVSLGFIPMWNILSNEQRNTPAFTTIFSFISALKTANNSSATLIDTLVSAQNINSAGINAFATNENNFPSPEVPQLAALPIYTTATVGGAATILRTSNDAGPTVTDRSGNKLGNHRFIRFMGNGNNVTITANSTSTLPHDVDFVVYRSVPFAFYRSATDPPAATEVLTMPTANAEYLIDVYDCANGCDPSEGTPGDYDLTVTIQ